MGALLCMAHLALNILKRPLTGNNSRADAPSRKGRELGPTPKSSATCVFPTPPKEQPTKRKVKKRWMRKEKVRGRKNAFEAGGVMGARNHLSRALLFFHFLTTKSF
jgi:hypothetical protein